MLMTNPLDYKTVLSYCRLVEGQSGICKFSLLYDVVVFLSMKRQGLLVVVCCNVGRSNVHSIAIACIKSPNLDICLVHAAFEERWIPYLMIHVCLDVSGLILGTTPVSHLSHEARDTRELL